MRGPRFREFKECCCCTHRARWEAACEEEQGATGHAHQSWAGTGCVRGGGRGGAGQQAQEGVHVVKELWKPCPMSAGLDYAQEGGDGMHGCELGWEMSEQGELSAVDCIPRQAADRLHFAADGHPCVYGWP